MLIYIIQKGFLHRKLMSHYDIFKIYQTINYTKINNEKIEDLIHFANIIY